MKLIGVSFGHNDEYNVGAVANHNGVVVKEDVLNKEVGQELIKIINNSGVLKAIHLYKDNVESYNDSIMYRPYMANSKGCYIAIDIHHNAVKIKSAYGSECLANSERGNKLGNCILKELTSSLGYANRGMKYNNYAFNKYTTMTSLIYEGFFITNYEDWKKYNPKKEAAAIFRGICKYLNIDVDDTPNKPNKPDSGIVVDTIIRVRSGDTLSAIALKFKTTVEEICLINDIDDPDKIFVGQILKLRKGYSIYIVKQGDTLSEIAQALGVTVDHLIDMNDIRDKNLINIGQHIRY